MRFGPALRATIFFALAILAVAGAGLLWMEFSPRRTPPVQPALAHLDAKSFPALRAAFNASIGQTRILVLLSPT